MSQPSGQDISERRSLQHSRGPVTDNGDILLTQSDVGDFLITQQSLFPPGSRLLADNSYLSR